MTEGGWDGKACLNFDETLLQMPVEDEVHLTQNEEPLHLWGLFGILVKNEK